MPVKSGKDFKGVTTQQIKCSVVADGTVEVAVRLFRFKEQGRVGVAKFDHSAVGVVLRAVHNSIVARAVSNLLEDATWNNGLDGARVKHIYASHVYRYTPLLLL